MIPNKKMNTPAASFLCTLSSYRASFAISLAFIAAYFFGTPAQGTVNGFNSFAGFQINQSDGSAAPSLSITDGVHDGIHLTGSASGESRSIFNKTLQNISQFTASFTYQETGTPTGGFGACFVIQDSPNGSQSVAAYNVLGQATQLGYSDFSGTLSNSIAISLEYGSLSSASSSSALYTGGNVGGGSANTSPLNIFSGDPINFTLTYNGSILHEGILDVTTSQSFSANYSINIPTTVTSTTAYVGFTASTNGNGSTDQFISNFQFAVPEPTVFSLLGTGAIMLGFFRRRSTTDRTPSQ